MGTFGPRAARASGAKPDGETCNRKSNRKISKFKVVGVKSDGARKWKFKAPPILDTKIIWFINLLTISK